jgi:4-amino-4-deoxy-L-arabinose transferase-like glycosyltransferase
MPAISTDSSKTGILDHASRSSVIGKMRSWLFTWEIYPIVFIAAFLRLYQISTTEFDEDQAMVFRMAYDAIHHGLLPATSNIASIRIVNPPAVIYLFMLPAAFSTNPLWGTVLVGLFNVIAVLLTYIFVRRYSGRLAAIVAALLYATAAKPVYFSRFIWQQNLIAPFVVLFIFTLFWGVVERRRGWLFPALLLLGILVQLHETTIVLAVPLLLALLLAPGTVRWRDLAFGIGSLLLIFSTYLLWEFATKFADLNVIFHVSKLPAHFDNLALTYYRQFFSPYDQIPTNTHTLVYMFVPLLQWLRRIMLLLVLGGFATALVGVIMHYPLWKTMHTGEQKNQVGGADDPPPLPPGSRPHGIQRLRKVWTEFRASPRRCGFLLLLVWQLVPILFLSRHAVPVYPYYLLVLMPGPFILIGIFLSKVAEGLQRLRGQWSLLHYGVYALACFVIIAQLVGSTAALIDETGGSNPHGYSYNTLNSLENALAEADQLAQQRHLNHVYVTTNQFTQVALGYLAEKMQTPTTLFDATQCLVLPGVADGPAVLLVGPYDMFTNALLSRFTVTSLVDRPKRLGGEPFKLYIVQPITEPKQSSTNDAFVNNLQLLDSHAQYISFNNAISLATRWELMRSVPPDFRETYTYDMRVQLSDRANIVSECTSTSTRAGDQLIVTFQVPRGSSLSGPMTIFAKSYTFMPYILSYGPLHLENIRSQRSPSMDLQTQHGGDSITLTN